MNTNIKHARTRPLRLKQKFPAKGISVSTSNINFYFISYWKKYHHMHVLTISFSDYEPKIELRLVQQNNRTSVITIQKMRIVYKTRIRRPRIGVLMKRVKHSHSPGGADQSQRSLAVIDPCGGRWLAEPPGIDCSSANHRHSFAPRGVQFLERTHSTNRSHINVS